PEGRQRLAAVAVCKFALQMHNALRGPYLEQAREYLEKGEFAGTPDLSKNLEKLSVQLDKKYFAFYERHRQGAPRAEAAARQAKVAIALSSLFSQEPGQVYESFYDAVFSLDDE
ncbi:unnamed protein product, partial [Phaeothamnion confervicola]